MLSRSLLLSPINPQIKDDKVDVNCLIRVEVDLYVNYCRLASEHDEMEEMYRALAHKIFYHIQEMRSTGKPSVLGIVS